MHQKRLGTTAITLTYFIPNARVITEIFVSVFSALIRQWQW